MSDNSIVASPYCNGWRRECAGGPLRYQEQGQYCNCLSVEKSQLYHSKQIVRALLHVPSTTQLDSLRCSMSMGLCLLLRSKHVTNATSCSACFATTPSIQAAIWGHLDASLILSTSKQTGGPAGGNRALEHKPVNQRLKMLICSILNHFIIWVKLLHWSVGMKCKEKEVDTVWQKHF